MLIRWLLHQVGPAREGFNQLRHSLFTTLMTTAVIGITLALPMTLKIILDNAALFSEQLKQTTTLTVFLKPDTSLQDMQQLAHTLQRRHDVSAIETISPSAGLSQLEQQTGLIPETLLPDNPIPWVIVITPASSKIPEQSLTQLKADLLHQPNIDTVQLDTEWVTRLSTFLKSAHQIALSLAVLLTLAVLFITGNTIWTVIQRHHREIQIIRLTGGTRQFIQRPFLYAGALYGLVGSLIAWLLTFSLFSSLSQPIHQLTALYHNAFSPKGLQPLDTLYLLFGGMLLGLLGAWFAVTRYLHAPETKSMAPAGKKMLE